MEDVAPEPYRTACLRVIYYATIEARALAWSDAARPEERPPRDRLRQIADLMDSVHNIPSLLNHWSECDEPMLRAFLRSYDEQWAGSGAYRLLDVYDRNVAGQQS